MNVSDDDLRAVVQSTSKKRMRSRLALVRFACGMTMCQTAQSIIDEVKND